MGVDPAPKIEVLLDLGRPGSPGELQEASRSLPGPPGGLPGPAWAPLGLGKSRTTSILGAGKNTHCPPVDKLLEIKKNKKAQTPDPQKCEIYEDIC